MRPANNTATGVLLALTIVGCSHRATDREVFAEAGSAARLMPDSSQWRVWSEIAAAEARRRYYDDAIAAARGAGAHAELVFARVAGIRAESGDLAGAKTMAGKAATAAGKAMALSAIAGAQFTAGDIPGAAETLGPSRGAPDAFGVRVRIGIRQAESGDMDAALTTASQTGSPTAQNAVLLAVAEAYHRRGNHERAREVASRIKDPEFESAIEALFAGRNLRAKPAECSDIPRAAGAESLCPSADRTESAALREMARAMVAKPNADSALRWARSRPTAPQRAFALLGVADGLPAKPGR